jgi:predicted HicB family RNase H-like nuclease
MIHYSYKGYSFEITFDEEDKVYHAKAAIEKDIVTAKGYALTETMRACQDSLEAYFEFCKELGESPDPSVDLKSA